jgi:threonylcarbamoyladenosine tRNA methylthiotransferase MtaB
VIVGFPGETEADFQATVDFIERLPFTYLHVFSFSERPGTRAAELSEHVERNVIRKRAQTLRAQAVKKSSAFRASQSGRTVRALTLARGGADWTEALTGNYLKVRIAGHRPANEWCDVRPPLDPEEVTETIGLPQLPTRSATRSEDPRGWRDALESSMPAAPLP